MRKSLLAALALVWSALSLLAPPVITQQPTNQMVLKGSNVVLSVQVSGIGPFNYLWQLNGTNLPNNIITTVAGGGNNYAGNGVIATNARLSGPNSAIPDIYGNLFIADGNVVLKVTADGRLNVFAGAGTNYPGDGGLATNASLVRATGLAIDKFGNVFVADYESSRVRKIDTNGIITTVAGGGTGRPGGIMATNAAIQPADVAVDNVGNLFIAGYLFNAVHEVDTHGIITTFAGGGSAYPGDGGIATNALIQVPQAVALDAAGDLFIAAAVENRVLKVDASGILATVAGGGSGGDGGMATNAAISQPSGVAVDAQGNLFFSEANWVKKVDTNGIITGVAGNGRSLFSGDGGAATNAALNSPQRVSVDAAGNLFIADSGDNRIRKVWLAGSPTVVLNKISVTGAGIYSVTITSPSGSVTSSNAALTVIVPPGISATLAGNGAISLSWSAQANFSYQLQYTTNLIAPVWQNLGSTITATNGTVTASDLPGADSQRFYRVELVQ